MFLDKERENLLNYIEGYSHKIAMFVAFDIFLVNNRECAIIYWILEGSD